jgi:hypothetical protein
LSSWFFSTPPPLKISAGGPSLRRRSEFAGTAVPNRSSQLVSFNSSHSTADDGHSSCCCGGFVRCNTSHQQQQLQQHDDEYPGYQVEIRCLSKTQSRRLPSLTILDDDPRNLLGDDCCDEDENDDEDTSQQPQKAWIMNLDDVDSPLLFYYDDK